jgi:hypothetical protein
MRVSLSDDYLEVRLSVAEKILGLMRDVRVERAQVTRARVVDRPFAEAMSAGLKAGLRLPGVYYVCRTLALDRVWAIRRGLPAVAVEIEGHRRLREVTASTAQAQAIAMELNRP